MAKRLGRVINILETYATSSGISEDSPDFDEYQKECTEIWKAVDILHAAYHKEVAEEERKK